MKKDIWICFFPRRVGCGSWRLPAANLGDKSITWQSTSCHGNSQNVQGCVGRGESREKNPSKVFLPLPLSQLCFFLLHNVFMATRNSRHKSHEQTFFIHPVGSQVNQLQNLTVSFVLKRFFFNFKNVFKLFIYVFFYILNFFCFVFWITFFSLLFLFCHYGWQIPRLLVSELEGGISHQEWLVPEIHVPLKSCIWFLFRRRSCLVCLVMMLRIIVHLMSTLVLHGKALYNAPLCLMVRNLCVGCMRSRNIRGIGEL